MTEEEKPPHVTWPLQGETHSWDPREAEIWVETLKAKGYSARQDAPGRKYYSSVSGYGVAVFLTPDQAKALAGDKQFIEVTLDGYRFTWMRTGDTMKVWGTDAADGGPIETFPIPTWLNAWTMDEAAVQAAASAWLAKRTEA